MSKDHSDTENTDLEKRGSFPQPLPVEEVVAGEGDESYPEGGLRAWLVAAGVACILFATLGWTNSFGVFFPYYQKNQLSSETPDRIAWIGSVQVTLTFATGVIGGPTFDRYGTLVSLPTYLGRKHLLSQVPPLSRSTASDEPPP